MAISLSEREAVGRPPEVPAPSATGRAGTPVPPARTGPLRQKVIQGATWTIACSLCNKVVTLAGQIVLARLLFPEDLGLVALAVSVTFPASLFSGGVLQAVLIQQQNQFARLAGRVFWLGVTLHTLAALIIAGLAPVAGMIFHDSRVVPLILLAALSTLLGSLTYTYTAKLYIDLRFRTLTAIQFGEGILQTALAVLLALCGFGPFAIMVPQLVVRLYAAGAYRLAAGPVPIDRFRPSLWPPLVAPSGWLMLHSLVNGLQLNGVILVIGLFHDSGTTGLFSWGNQVASQAILLLVLNLRNIFFPTLMKLNDEPARQRSAFLRAAKALTVAGLSVCLLQALAAPYLIPVIFGDRWAPAIPVVVWLSIGLATGHLDLLVISLLGAQRRNRTLALLATGQTAVILLAVSLSAALAGTGATAAVLGLVTAGTNVLVFLVVFGHYASARVPAGRPELSPLS